MFVCINGRRLALLSVGQWMRCPTARDLLDTKVFVQDRLRRRGTDAQTLRVCRVVALRFLHTKACIRATFSTVITSGGRPERASPFNDRRLRLNSRYQRLMVANDVADYPKVAAKFS